MTFNGLRPISNTDNLSSFACGNGALDRWLQTRALKSERTGDSHTYVVCEAGRAVAYYCLANGSVERKLLPGKTRRNAPDPVPVMLLVRLAVDRSRQGKGLGAPILRDAMTRTLEASAIAGMRALIVHAVDERAAAFYARHGFSVSPESPLLLLFPLDTARKVLA